MMNKRMFIFLVLVLSLVFVQVGVASITYSPATDRITVTSDVVNLTEIWNDIVLDYNETYINEMALEQVSPGVWEQKARLYAFVDGGMINIEYPDCKELRISYDSSSLHIGRYVSFIGPLTVSTWNETTNLPEHDPSIDQAIIRSAGTLSDVEFNGINHLYLGWNYDDGYKLQIKNKTYNNITVKNSYHGMELYADNCTYTNLTFLDNHPAQGTGVDASSVDNSTFTDYIAINVSDHTTPATSAYGMNVLGDNNILQNIYIDGTGWSGTSFSGENWVIDNITVMNTGHNGIEYYNNNSTINDITLKYIDYYSGDNEGNALFVQGTPVYNYHNLTYTNATMSDFSGDGIHIGEVSSHLIFRDMVINGTGIGAGGASDTLYDNLTIFNGIYACQISDGLNDVGSLNNTIMNSNLTSSGGVNSVRVSSAECTLNVANTYVDDFYLVGGNYTVLYPLNMMVQDASNNPVDNATITITTDSFTLDGLGHEQSVFTTGADGKPTEQINLANLTRDSSTGYVYHFSNITVSKDGETDSKYNIVPDSSWYSPDPSDLQGPLQTFVLSAETPVTPTTVSWDEILGKAQSDTESAISLGSILPITIIAVVIIGLLIMWNGGLIEFDMVISAILVLLVVSLMLMVSLPIFNSLYG